VFLTLKNPLFDGICFSILLWTKNQLPKNLISRKHCLRDTKLPFAKASR